MCGEYKHQRFSVDISEQGDHRCVGVVVVSSRSCSDGNLRVVNPTTGKVDRVLHVHDGEITSLILSYDRTMLATSSKDAKAKVFDAHTLEEILSFATDRPLNSVALSPIRDHLVTVGGVEARDVTTSHSEKMEVGMRTGVERRGCFTISLPERRSAESKGLLVP